MRTHLRNGLAAILLGVLVTTTAACTSAPNKEDREAAACTIETYLHTKSELRDWWGGANSYGDRLFTLTPVVNIDGSAVELDPMWIGYDPRFEKLVRTTWQAGSPECTAAVSHRAGVTTPLGAR